MKMKLTSSGISTILCLMFSFHCLFSVQLMAQDNGKNQLITISKENTTVRVVLDAIEKTTSYRFFYNNLVVDPQKQVSINVKDKPLNAVLDELFTGMDISYSIMNDQVVLSPKAGNTAASAKTSKITISGLVIEAGTKQPIIGASVIEKGTSNGTITGTDGRFTLNVSKDATLEFSYIGYKPTYEPVNGRITINASLSEDLVQIDQIVAIGYGSQRKEDLSTSVSTIKVDDIAKGRPSNIATVLQGRIPGLSVQTSGDPMDKASLSIRGRGSKGKDDDPTSGDGILYVVDGVPGAPYMVDDIETITVLKDAASAAIYGASVGSSGVILITTKRAKAGVTRVDVNASIGFQKVRNLPKTLTAEEYNMVWAKAVENSPGSSLPSAANPELFPWGTQTRTNWLDEIFQTGKTQHYGATISGGSEKIQSLFSMAYDKTDGTLLNTYSESFIGKLNTDIKLTNWLKFSERVTVKVANGQGDVDTSHEGPIMGAMWYPRSASVYEMNQDGSYALDNNGEKIFGGTSPRWASVSGYPNIYNPVAVLERLRRNYPEHQIFSTTSLELKPVSGLTVRSDFTIDLANRERDEFYPIMKEPGLQRAMNKREQFLSKDNHWLWESTASYSRVFGGKHHVSALAGFTMDYKKYNTRNIYTQNYTSELDYEFTYDGSDWSTERRPGQEIYENSMLSVLGRVGYSYDDRYFVTGSVRRDASSKLPSAKNYDVFPAFSGSWKLSSEKFFKNLGIEEYVDLVKFRGGWGKVGNVELYDPSVTDVNYLTYKYNVIFGLNLDKPGQGTYMSTIPNYNARWETTEQASFGLDLSLFKRSLDISIDYYDKQTKDLVDFIPIPQHVGVSENPKGNMGTVVNKGWEFSLSYRGHVKDFNYNVWGMLSLNDGYVEEYGNQPTPIEHNNPNLNSRPLLYSFAGHPWRSFKVYKTAGTFKSVDDVLKYIYKNPNTGETKIIQPDAKPGDLRFVDTNSDGIINDDDMVLAGSYSPKKTFSFGAALDYKGFDLSVMFQGVSGNYIYNGLKQMGSNGKDQGGNLVADVLDSYDFNPNSDYPRLGLLKDTNGNFSKHSDLFLERGDYLRLKNLTIGYSIPASAMKRMGLGESKIRVYFSADNLLTFTDYTGCDPEVGNYGVERGVYPTSRFFNFGVNMNF